MLFDSFGHLVKIVYPSGGYHRTFDYDGGASTNGAGVGRLAAEYNPGFAGSNFFYDSMGRVTSSEWIDYNSDSWRTGMQAAYDASGHVTQLTYPDGRIVMQAWNSAGQLAAVWDQTGGSVGAVYLSGPEPASGGATCPVGLPSAIKNCIGYSASGQMTAVLYGNGVTQATSFNSRSQICAQAASTPLLPSVPSGGNLINRQLFYGETAETNCRAATGNDGDIWHIIEGPDGSSSQAFSYDRLNRLSSAYSANRPPTSTYNFTYDYDSFGNMLPIDHLHTPMNFGRDSGTNRLTLNGDVTTGDLQYYNNGELKYAPDGSGSHHLFGYTAEGYIRSIDNSATGSYLYDGEGQRTLADGNQPNVWNEYVYLNGQTMATWNWDKATNQPYWTDFICANGQKIAQIKPQTNAYRYWGNHVGWHMPFGVSTSFQNVSTISTQIGGLRNGDTLSYDLRMPVSGTVGGLYISVSGGSTLMSNGTVANSAAYASPTTGWEHYSFEIGSGNPNGTITDMGLNLDHNTCWCDWEIDVANVVLTRADGSIVPILTSNAITTSTYLGTLSDSSNQDAGGSEYLNGAMGEVATDGDEGTNYYLADQVGTTQMELSSGGWPIWQGWFTPFGQEIVNGGEQNVVGDTPADGTDNRYKFTSKERDAESGLDYFGARYYSSSIGRWLSPDYDNTGDDPEPIPYADLEGPQSLNLYSYVGNNPLYRKDPDGHSYVVYDGSANTLTLYSGTGERFGVYPAYNNVDSRLSLGKLPDGTYPVLDQSSPHMHGDSVDPHDSNLQDSEDGEFGPGGIFRIKAFKGPDGKIHRGIGVHAGRKNKRDRAGRTGPAYATNGCVRTCDAAIHQITNTVKTDPLTSLIVTFNQPADNSSVTTTQGPATACGGSTGNPCPK